MMIDVDCEYGPLYSFQNTLKVNDNGPVRSYE